ncbi:molecular chaperone TorD family protein [Gordonia sp. CPCC 205515]|uniref:molecular chaperone TorD family protein n=1 Tax=Gordonia sp. CPCC 205515 TaxID=3140791 RepID=UPI003AF3AFBF
MTAATDTGLRVELIRSLGAVAHTPPPESGLLFDALGLPTLTGAAYTRAFVLSAPPHAAIHLGPDGKLGGIGLDRVEGFWRAAGQHPPADADHLGVLLMCYADVRGQIRSPGAHRIAESLFHEHIWPWAPGYLQAVSLLGDDAVTQWAQLTMAVLDDEYGRLTPPDPLTLPLALREAPAPVAIDDDFEDLLDALVSPVRAGFVLTHHTLSCGAAAVGVGYRRGERRFALKAMLDQDKSATLTWLSTHAHDWARWRATRDDAASRWWETRADATADALNEMRGNP